MKSEEKEKGSLSNPEVVRTGTASVGRKKDSVTFSPVTTLYEDPPLQAPFQKKTAFEVDYEGLKKLQKREKRKIRREKHRQKCEKMLEITVYAASPLCIVCSTMSTVVGLTQLNECPLEPMIPVFALMFGCFSIVIHCLTWIWYKFEYDTSQQGRSNRKMNWLELTLIVLHSILFIWILQGLFWTFYRFDELNLSVSALGDPDKKEFFCDSILYFVSVCFPIGHVLMVFLLLLPKKILSRQTEAKMQMMDEYFDYSDLYNLPEDNQSIDGASVKFVED